MSESLSERIRSLAGDWQDCGDADCPDCAWPRSVENLADEARALERSLAEARKENEGLRAALARSGAGGPTRK